MVWRALPAILLVAVFLSSAPGVAGDGHCTPGRDATATPVADRFYVRIQNSGFGNHLQLWQETNGIPGLQYSEGMGCGADPDQLIVSQCINTICQQLPLG